MNYFRLQNQLGSEISSKLVNVANSLSLGVSYVVVAEGFVSTVHMAAESALVKKEPCGDEEDSEVEVPMVMDLKLSR